MPIPTYNQTQPPLNANDNQARATTGTNTNTTSNTSSQGMTTNFAGNPVSGAVNGQGQPLSKEEADRLYEERMEDEYAKREGGA
ncbi:hypothetical protein BJX99DRAFT_219916 [Aspergillus californicus]